MKSNEYSRALYGFVNLFEINKLNKLEIEIKELELLKRNNIELIVLARYMQILSPEFVEKYPNKIINIHHSFLLPTSNKFKKFFFDNLSYFV